jgi:hypothetical protein
VCHGAARLFLQQEAGLKAKPVPPDLTFTLKQLSSISFQKLRIIKRLAIRKACLNEIL